MTKKEALIIGLIALLVIGGPIYVLLRGNTPEVTQSQPKVATSEPAQPAQDLPLKVTFDKTKYSLTDPTSIWLVVNKKRPISPVDYAPTDLVAVGTQRLRSEPAARFSEMIAAAKVDFLTITGQSGYRSYATQVSVYNNEVKTYGQAVADTQSARPGTSEHQTGLGIDVGGGGCNIEDCFDGTAEGQWVAKNAHKFGFIIRYPEGKQAITGYRYEPWHLRYVGVELATEMQKQGVLTLEEFFDLPAAPTY